MRGISTLKIVTNTPKNSILIIKAFSEDRKHIGTMKTQENVGKTLVINIMNVISVRN
jgi:hypothetical protein